MGILNLTPDSFSDGGAFLDPELALRQARRMFAAGADVLDIGGESTRPGASPVTSQEEWRRIGKIVTELVAEIPLPLSVDTRHAETAKLALASGVSIINDVSCARDTDLLKAVAESGAAYVLMHSRGDPATMASLAVYQDVVGEVITELRLGLERCWSAGIQLERICIDPGFGFAKSPEQNWRLLESLDRLAELGRPILVGISRKRMLRERIGEEPSALLAAGLAAAETAIHHGARILRVHDVGPTRDFLQALQKSAFSID